MHTTNKTSNRPAIAGLIVVTAFSAFAVSAFGRQQGGRTAAVQIPALTTRAAALPAQPPQADTAQPPQSSQESEGPQTLHLLVGRSIVITSPSRIKRISLADPNIAEAVVVTPYQVVVNGKTPGGVSLIIWDEAGQSQSFEVSVDIDVLGLVQKIHEVFPAEPVQIETSKDVVLLSGRISSPAVADKILEVVKNTTPKVTSLMEIPSLPEVEIALQVKFADVNRQVVQQLGANFIRNFGTNMPMAVGTQQFAPPQLGSLTSTTTSGQTTTTSTSGQNTFSLSDILNIFIDRPDIGLAATIKALQENNLLQILAEPNLLTQSGKPASFLAGGQFPYPVVQSVTGGTSGAITIQFKDYGVRLSFLPTVTPDGLIHLKVTPEVSSLDYTNAVTLNGFVLPAITVNRAESEMDLRDGQSFAIAGLLDNRVTKQFEKIPGIGDIPILGKLFQSRSLSKSDNELLIVVTPHIVRPLAPGEVPPGPAMPERFLPPLTPAEQKEKANK